MVTQNSPQLFPAILCESLAEVEAQVAIVEPIEELEAVQIDIMDGFLVERLTVSPLDLGVVDFGHLKCDLHLMVDEPLDFVWEALMVKDRVPFQSMIAQVEHMSSQAEYLSEVRQHQWQTGLSLDIFTPLEAIDELSWADLDILQLMGNHMGVQGQSLHDHIWEKLTQANQIIKQQQLKTQIYLDIGVSATNLPKLLKAGVSGLAVGSDIWEAEEPAEQVKKFLGLLTE